MPAAPSSPWSSLLALARPDAGRYAALTAIVAVASSLGLAGPLVLRAIVDGAGRGMVESSIVGLAMLYLAVAVSAQGLTLVVTGLATSTAWHTADQLRAHLARHVLALDYEFHRSHSPGELIQRIDGDVTSVSDFLAMVAVRVLSTVMLVVGIVVVVAVVDGWLGLAMAAYVGATVAVVYHQRNRSTREAATEMSAAARLYGGIEERLTAAEDLRAHGAQTYAVWRFVEDTIQYVATVVDRKRAFSRVWRALQTVIIGGVVGTIVIGAVGVDRGLITVGTALLLFQYAQMIRRPFEDLLHELEVVHKANGAMDRIVGLLAEEPRIVDRGQSSPAPGPLAVELVDVDAAYGDDPPVLRNVSVAIGAGRTVGVVGRTGSGKTTLSRVVARLIDPVAGEVRLGGVPLVDIPLQELRRRVAVMSQHVDLFAGSVADNLTLFDPTVDDGAIDGALAAVDLDQWVGRAHEVELGPQGAGLSAGEAQLLALARLWLRDPDLLLLDEPTARVDPETEAALDAAVTALCADRTVLLIAHRLSTLHRMDDILVVDGGEVVEHGRRVDLEADPGSRYHQLLAAGGLLTPVGDGASGR